MFSPASSTWIRTPRIRPRSAYPAAIKEPKEERVLRRRCRVRQCKYLNNIIEQDHRTVKRRTWLAIGYGSFRSAWRTLQRIEEVNMIRKGSG
jgi:transposase, IS6 family